MKPCTFSVETKRSEVGSETVEKLKNTLVQQGFTLTSNNPDLVIAVGGDGTLLRILHEHRMHGKYLPVNAGHLGFYSDYSIEDLDTLIKDILEKEPTIQNIPVYSFFVGGVEHPFINDVSIQSGATCFLKIYVNNEFLTEARCSGIVVATPIGTTGFLTSLDSPVIVSSVDIYQYSLLAPCYNRLYPNPIRKAIIKGSDTLRIEVLRGMYDVYLDGGKKPNYKGGIFSFSHHRNRTISFLRFREQSYTARLRTNISGKE